MSIQPNVVKDATLFEFPLEEFENRPTLTQFATTGAYGVVVTVGTALFKQFLRPRLWNPTKRFRFRFLWGSTTPDVTTTHTMRGGLSVYPPIGDQGVLGFTGTAETFKVDDNPVATLATNMNMVSPWSGKFASLASRGWTKDKDLLAMLFTNFSNEAGLVAVTGPIFKAIQIAVG